MGTLANTSPVPSPLIGVLTSLLSHDDPEVLEEGKKEDGWESWVFW